MRSDGSTMRGRRLVKPGNRGETEQRTITDLSQGKRILVDGLTDSLSTVFLSQNSVTRAKGRALSACPAVDRSTRSNILGYEVFRWTYDQHGGGQVFRNEEWLAPDLNCLSLKTTVLAGTSESDLRMSNVEEVIEVKRGEPDASLFAIPSTYSERSPQSVAEEFRHRYPEEPLCLKCGRSDEALEKKYLESRTTAID